jgi:hypothetical protein
MDVGAQRQSIDPRGVSLTPADLPRGFSIIESQTAFEPLRTGQSSSDSDVVGVNFRTLMERPRTLENLQTGPVRVGQIIARSDDPARATFSLDAQREYNVREHGYQAVEAPATAQDVLCLMRRDGPFVEYRIVAVKNADTLISTTAIGLPSAVTVESAVALTGLSLARYDEQMNELLAAQPPPAAAPSRLDADFRAVATATPTPVPPSTSVPPTSSPASTPTARPATSTATAPRVKLPSRFDDRLAPAWSELMASTATTKSGEKMTAFLRRVVDETDLKVSIGNLGPNVAGELRSVADRDGDKGKIIEREITINKDVMNESPRVLAAMLAHEITHASQPIVRSDGRLLDCVEAEVEAYAVEARVWAGFWGQAERPQQTSWERSFNYTEEVWKDSGEDGLRQLIRLEHGVNVHSCIE